MPHFGREIAPRLREQPRSPEKTASCACGGVIFVVVVAFAAIAGLAADDATVGLGLFLGLSVLGTVGWLAGRWGIRSLGQIAKRGAPSAWFGPPAVMARSGGAGCTHCAERIEPAEETELCPNCSAVYHRACYGDRQHCGRCGAQLWDIDMDLLPTELRGQNIAATGPSGTCPYCQSAVGAGVAVTICPRCGVPHHQECWTENGGCTTYGCSFEPPG